MSLLNQLLKVAVPANPLIVFLCGLCCFIPLISGPFRDYSNSPEINGIKAQSNRELAVAAAALTLPIFLEILTDATIGIGCERHEKIKSHAQCEFLNTQERLLVAFSILASSAPALMNPGLLNLVNIYHSFHRCRAVFTGGALMLSLHRYDEFIWPMRTVTICILCLCVGSIFASFADNMLNHEMSFIVHEISFVLCLVSFSTIALCSIRWMSYNIPIICAAWTSTSGELIGCKYDKIFPLLHIATLTIIGGALIVETRLNQGNPDKASRFIFPHNLIYVLYTVLIMYISVRKMKFEIIHGLVSNDIDLKLTFSVRFLKLPMPIFPFFLSMP